VYGRNFVTYRQYGCQGNITIPYNTKKATAANISFVRSTEEKLREDRKNKKLKKFKDNGLENIFTSNTRRQYRRFETICRYNIKVLKIKLKIK